MPLVSLQLYKSVTFKMRGTRLLAIRAALSPIYGRPCSSRSLSASGSRLIFLVIISKFGFPWQHNLVHDFPTEPYVALPAVGTASPLPQLLRFTASFAQLTRAQPSLADTWLSGHQILHYYSRNTIFEILKVILVVVRIAVLLHVEGNIFVESITKRRYFWKI